MEHIIKKVEAYEYFKGGEDREKRIDDFLSNKTTHLNLDYPDLNNLKTIKSIYHNNASAVWEESKNNVVTNPYELAQASLVLQAAAAQRLLIKGDKTQLVKAQERLKEMNHELFGSPNKTILLMAKKTTLDLINRNSLEDDSLLLMEELMHGFVFKGDDGREVEVKPFLSQEEIETLEDAPKLPELSDKALKKLHEKINEEFGYARKIIEKYWIDHIDSRPKEDRYINSEDAKILFKECVKNFPNMPEANSVNILYEPESTATSWSSEESSIIVAGKRNPFKDVDDFLGVFVHEFGVHARRYLNGQKSNIPALAKGVYTMTAEGTVEDYLTFEEGLAATLQKAAYSNRQKWDIGSLGLYLVAGLAEEGRSDREIFEILYRLRLLTNNSRKIKSEDIKKARKNALTQVIRIFRGMPITEYIAQIPVTYLKDMAYLNGKIKAVNYLNSMDKLNDEEWIKLYDELFVGKIDNTNEEQRKLGLNNIDKSK